MFSLLSKYLLLFVFCFSVGQIRAGNEPGKPRLIISIVIDGLQTEHLMTLWNEFGKGGFKRLYGEGAVCRNTYYPILSSGNAGDYATIVTGTTPYYHGISGNLLYNTKTSSLVPCLFDPLAPGINTSETVSPRALLATTVADELKINSGGKSKVYSIGIHTNEAVLLAGHAADGAVWLSDKNFLWATTSFYPSGLPQWADRMNMDNAITTSAYSNWQPLNPVGSYQFPPRHRDALRGFIYFTTGASPTEIIANYKKTPLVNSVVKNLALRALDAEQMGLSGNTDYLGLEFTLQVQGDDSYELASAEKEDSYLRLDSELSDLLSKIDEKLGLNNILVMITATQGENHSQATLNAYRINTGRFVPSKSMSLLNLYLMAVYGQNQWVTGYNNKNVYLDRTTIEKKNISLPEIQQRCATFMLDLQGVQTACSADQIMMADGKGYDEQARMKNSFSKGHSGDVVFSLMPGWVEANDDGSTVAISNKKESYVPLILFGYTIKPQIIPSASITDIAPTLSYLLQISNPNACTGRGIFLEIK